MTFSLSTSASSKHLLSPIFFSFLNVLADEGERREFIQAVKQQKSMNSAPSGQTGVRITASGSLSTSCFHLGRVERSRAHPKCSAALQGRSKHSLSDLGAGTEQSPELAGLDGCQAAVDGLRRREEGWRGGEGRCCQKTKRPLTATTLSTRIGQSSVGVCVCASAKEGGRHFEFEILLIC